MFSFLSIEFALSFILFFGIYWAFRYRPQIQNFILVITSYLLVFLMAGGLAITILLIFSLIVYLISILMDRYVLLKKKLLISGIVITLIQLSIFKYYDFFKPLVSESLDKFNLDNSGLAANLILPLGISYYSFQAISYLVSRYRNEIDCPRFNLIQLFDYNCRPYRSCSECKGADRY